jgi:sugar lactone lactonase YvrE
MTVMKEYLSIDDATGDPIRKGKLDFLAQPLDPQRQKYQRFNDGACDPMGRFFAGTLRTLNPPLSGQLWMYDPNVEGGKAILVDDDIEVSPSPSDYIDVELCLTSHFLGEQWHGMEC